MNKKKNQISRNNILYCTQSQKSYYIIKSAFIITLKTISLYLNICGHIFNKNLHTQNEVLLHRCLNEVY